MLITQNTFDNLPYYLQKIKKKSLFVEELKAI